MNATPFPGGVTCSPANVGDADELSRLFNDIAEADDTPERLSPSSMEHELSSYFDPLEERTLVVRNHDDRIVGYATAYSRRAEADEMRAYVNVYIAPGSRHQGIDDPMTEWAIEAGTAALRNVEAERRFVCAWLYKKQEEASARFADRGFTPVRHWWDMERPLADAIPDRPEKGFLVEQWTEEHDEPARLVYNAAFADHWGSTPMDESSWREQVIASPNFKRELSYVATDGAQLLGYSACEEYPEDWEAAGRREAWIAGLGVVRSWRKRGIATALMTRSMRAMRDAGTDTAMIGVDSDSPSGAQHLYQSLGFTTKTTGVTWQLEID